MDTLNELALLLLKLTRLSRTQVCIAAKLSPQNASHWLNGRVDAFSIEKQSNFLKELGVRVEQKKKEFFTALMPEKLHHWTLDTNIVDVRQALESIHALDIKQIKILRYIGVPSREAVLMIPNPNPVSAETGHCWIHLALDKTVTQPSTINASVLGFGTDVNLSAKDWFLGINSGETDFSYLRRYFTSCGMEWPKLIEYDSDGNEVEHDDYDEDVFGDDDEEVFGDNDDEALSALVSDADKIEWLALLVQLRQNGLAFEKIKHKICVLFDL